MNTLEKVKAIDEEGKGLTEWEVNFIAGIIDSFQTVFSPRQAKVVSRIYDQRVPK